MIKQYILYLLRWQLSTPILAAVMIMFNLPEWVEAIIANLIGAVLFYNVDRRIFNRNTQNSTRYGTNNE